MGLGVVRGSGRTRGFHHRCGDFVVGVPRASRSGCHRIGIRLSLGGKVVVGGDWVRKGEEEGLLGC